MAGVDLRTVAELLGHRTLQMVMRYSHLTPKHQASAVDRLVKAGKGRNTKSDTGTSDTKESKKRGSSQMEVKTKSYNAERWQSPVECT